MYTIAFPSIKSAHFFMPSPSLNGIRFSGQKGNHRKNSIQGNVCKADLLTINRRQIDFSNCLAQVKPNLLSFQGNNDTFSAPKAICGDLPPELLTTLPDITQKGKRIGGGSEGTVYMLSNVYATIPKCIVKVPHTEPLGQDGRTQFIGQDFSKEAAILSKLPDNIGSQLKLLGLVQTPIGKMMVTTFVKGKILDPRTNPLNTKNMQSLLSLLYKLDEAGIYHSDLHENNILYTSDCADVIDYGEAFLFFPAEQKERFNPARNIFTPSFVPLGNALNFQTKGLPLYFNQLLVTNPQAGSQVRHLFKQFLISKAEYQNEYLKDLKCKLAPNTLRFLQLENKVLSNPSEAIINLEAWKMQSMYCFGMSGRNTDFFNRLLDGLIWRVYGIVSAQQVIHKSTQLLKNTPENDSNMKEFLAFQKRYGEFLRREGLHFKTNPKALSEKILNAPSVINIAKYIEKADQGRL
jgi:hypothetical protein